MVDLAPIGAMVPDDVKQLAEDEIASFKSGEKNIFTIFTGPLKDQSGAEKVPAGTALMTAEELLGMNWFVEGVEGDPPVADQGLSEDRDRRVEPQVIGVEWH